MERTRICVLTSGGVESSSLLVHYAKKKFDIFPVYVRHGFIWEKAELFWLRKLLHRLKLRPVTVLDYSLRHFYKNHWSMTGKNIPGPRSKDEAVYIPGKNFLLVSLASVFCYMSRIHRVALGTLKQNPFPDSRAPFFRDLEKTIFKGLSYRLRTERPFAGRVKKEVIQTLKNMPWELTFSCIHPKGFRHCGSCNKCAERVKGFREAGIKI